MKYLYGVIAIFVSTSVLATKPTPTPETYTVPSVTQAQEQAQNQNQSQNQSQTATGTATNSFTASERTIGIANTAPAPLHDTPPCYLPAKGIRRIRQVLFGVVSFDSRLVKDEGCMADLQSARDFEIARLKAETELEKARTERVVAESEANCCLRK